MTNYDPDVVYYCTRYLYPYPLLLCSLVTQLDVFPVTASSAALPGLVSRFESSDNASPRLQRSPMPEACTCVQSFVTTLTVFSEFFLIFKS